MKTTMNSTMNSTMKTTMNAIIYEHYGTPDVMKYTEVDEPIVKEDEVLVKVKASSYNKADSIVLNGKPFLVRLMGNGAIRPKHRILGTDFAGIIESIGAKVTHIKIGDEVFGDMVLHGFGALGEYVCVPATVLAKKPQGFSFEEVASLPIAGVTALKAVNETTFSDDVTSSIYVKGKEKKTCYHRFQSDIRRLYAISSVNGRRSYSCCD